MGENEKRVFGFDAEEKCIRNISFLGLGHMYKKALCDHEK